MTTDNPYTPPTEPQNPAGSWEWLSGVPALILWFVLAAGVWYGQLQLLPIYEDFGVVLPPVTRLAGQAPVPLVLLLIGVAFCIAAIKTENRKRRLLNNLSMITVLCLSAVAIYAFLRPFIGLTSDLS